MICGDLHCAAIKFVERKSRSGGTHFVKYTWIKDKRCTPSHACNLPQYIKVFPPLRRPNQDTKQQLDISYVTAVRSILQEHSPRKSVSKNLKGLLTQSMPSPNVNLRLPQTKIWHNENLCQLLLRYKVYRQTHTGTKMLIKLALSLCEAYLQKAFISLTDYRPASERKKILHFIKAR